VSQERKNRLIARFAEQKGTDTEDAMWFCLGSNTFRALQNPNGAEKTDEELLCELLSEYSDARIYPC